MEADAMISVTMCSKAIRMRPRPRTTISTWLSAILRRVVRFIILRPIVAEDLDLGGLIRDFAPDDETIGAVGFDDAPLLADSHHFARQPMVLAKSRVGADFRHIAPWVELASRDVAREAELRR